MDDNKTKSSSSCHHLDNQSQPLKKSGPIQFHFVNTETPTNSVITRNVQISRLDGRRRRPDSALISSGALSNWVWDQSRTKSQKDPLHTSKSRPGCDHRSGTRRLPSDNGLLRNSKPSFGTSLMTILKKGNSDPFNTFATPIDPGVNNLMLFCRNFFLPSLYRIETQSVNTAIAAARDWEDFIAALHDSGTAYGYLSRLAVVKGSITGDSTMATQALMYRNQSSALLRAHITKSSNPNDLQTHRSVYALFTADLVARNLSRASIHARVLAHLLQRVGRHSTIDPAFLRRVLFNGMQRTSMTLSRSAFDLEKWVPKQFHDEWKQVLESIPLSSREASRFLDPSVDKGKLRVILIDLREQFEAYKILVSDSTSQKLFNFFSVTSRVLVDCLRLLNHYVDVTTQVRSTEMLVGSPAFPQGYAYIQTYTCLATVYWIRAISMHDVPVGSIHPGAGNTVFDTSSTILIHLWQALSQSETHTLPMQPTLVYPRLRLWALYIAATAERDESGSQEDAEDGWYNVRFAAQAKSMKLHSWQDVRKILEGFLYTDFIQSDGSRWFEEMMGLR